METVSVFGSANPRSPGAPPRNSLSVKPESDTPTRRMITPDTIGANRNRSFSITRVRHNTRNISELTNMDVPAAANDPAVPAEIISASNAADGPCTMGRRTSFVAWMSVTRPDTMKMAFTMFDDNARGRPMAPATNTGSSHTFDTSTCCRPSSVFFMVAFLTVRSVVVSFAFRGGSAFCDGAACVVSDDDAVPAMVPSLLRRLLARAENTKGLVPLMGATRFPSTPYASVILIRSKGPGDDHRPSQPYSAPLYFGRRQS